MPLALCEGKLASITDLTQCCKQLYMSTAVQSATLSLGAGTPVRAQHPVRRTWNCARRSMQGVQIGRLYSDDLSAPWALCIPVQQLLIGGEEAVPPAAQATGTRLLHAPAGSHDGQSAVH